MQMRENQNTSHRLPAVELRLPSWVDEVLASAPGLFPSDDDRMAFVIELARRNVRERTGGPFGAAVFEAETGRLLAPGVNLVEPAHCSVAHAEMMALMMAQAVIGSHDLSATGLPRYELFTSSEPCAMCFGALPWSGVARLVCGAPKEEAEAVGFDEGAKPEDWVEALEERGITVTRGVLTQSASQVLRDYAASGQTIYNANQSPLSP